MIFSLLRANVLSLFSKREITSGIANKPKRTAIKLKPALNSTIPNVNLVSAVAKSVPIVAIESPMSPAIEPLKILFPETKATVVKPKVIKSTYSDGPKFNAISAK